MVQQIGDEVAISTTSYNASETEKRCIVALSADNRVLTLNQPLNYTHLGQELPTETVIFKLFMFIFHVTVLIQPFVSSGETHSVSGTSFSYTLAADVALLTRNIKIIGEEYPQMMEESFGARLLVGAYSWAGIDYKGNGYSSNL